jgi:hypothetical protein
VDWSTIASLGTAGGTMVLGLATFASVRSSNRAARLAERNLLAGIRPVLFASQLEDPEQKVGWHDQHFERVKGGRGVFTSSSAPEGDSLYLAISVRNVGSGIAVLHGWYPRFWETGPVAEPTDPSEFRRLTRDLYVPAGGLGFWQGAVRDADDPFREALTARLADRERFMIDVLYGDLEGGQRTISRFGLSPLDDDTWLATVGRHWHLDREDPR